MSQTLPDNFEELPKFQKLQYLFAAHIRNPEQQPYDAEQRLGTSEIEARRLRAYEHLFFNNVYDFFSNLFPVLKSIVGEARWAEIVREYMQKHQSRTPLFHELGQEFILFLQHEYESKDEDPDYMLEMAHYEWVELAVSIDEHESFARLNKDTSTVDAVLDDVYVLSSVAWPLAYEWPVHEISADNADMVKPDWVTTLLVYRDNDDQVQFMNLSPLLYELLQRIANTQGQTMEKILTDMAEEMGQDVSELSTFALQILQNLLDEHLIAPISFLKS